MLLILTTAFFTLGYNLWSLADSNMARIENAFMTIGTVEQKTESLEIYSMWDAEKNLTETFHSLHTGKGSRYQFLISKRPIIYLSLKNGHTM